ncbi:MAG: hypothetical protein GXO79_03970 [Chlorobi bacterium]|nr:hypothetical protein [Chlorobiota bacterium]
MILRFPVVPGINTEENHLLLLEAFLKEINCKNIYQLNLLPYHKIGIDKYERFNIGETKPEYKKPAEEYLRKLKVRFGKIGFEIKIGG